MELASYARIASETPINLIKAHRWHGQSGRAPAAAQLVFILRIINRRSWLSTTTLHMGGRRIEWLRLEWGRSVVDLLQDRAINWAQKSWAWAFYVGFCLLSLRQNSSLQVYSLKGCKGFSLRSVFFPSFPTELGDSLSTSSPTAYQRISLFLQLFLSASPSRLEGRATSLWFSSPTSHSGWAIFHHNLFTIFGFSSSASLPGWEVFHQLIYLVPAVFLSSFLLCKVERVFTNALIS